MPPPRGHSGARARPRPVRKLAPPRGSADKQALRRVEAGRDEEGGGGSSFDACRRRECCSRPMLKDESCRAGSLTSGQPPLGIENGGEPSTPPLHVSPLWLGHHAVAAPATTAYVCLSP